jgi:cytochrome c556
MNRSKTLVASRLSRVLGGAVIAGLVSFAVLAQNGPPPGGPPPGGPPPGGAGGGPPGPQKSPGERQVEYRQAVFTVLAANFGPVAAEAGGKAPFDAAEIQLRVPRVAAMAGMVGDAFPDSSKDVGGTKAKPEVWTNAAKFAAAVKELQSKSAALATLVASDKTNSPAFQKAVGDVGAACKGCHDDFRNH